MCMQCAGCISDVHTDITEKNDPIPLKMCNLNLSHTFKNSKLTKYFCSLNAIRFAFTFSWCVLENVLHFYFQNIFFIFAESIRNQIN